MDAGKTAIQLLKSEEEMSAFDIFSEASEDEMLAAAARPLSLKLNRHLLSFVDRLCVPLTFTKCLGVIWTQLVLLL